MEKCPPCLSLTAKAVDAEPHPNLGHRYVLLQTHGEEERYTCTVCHTKWRRKLPNGSSPVQHYRWTVM